MKAFRIEAPGVGTVVDVEDIAVRDGEALLRVAMVGMCGTDLSAFRGKISLVKYPRIPGHEIAAVVVEGGGELAAGTVVTISPYSCCGVCSSCRRGRVNACKHNETLGVQRDGAMKEYISVPREKLFAANLSIKELCLVEPLSVGFHAVARGRVEAKDTVAVLGCGGVGLGAIAAAAFDFVSSSTPASSRPVGPKPVIRCAAASASREASTSKFSSRGTISMPENPASVKICSIRARSAKAKGPGPSASLCGSGGANGFAAFTGT